ncbi:MAG: 4-hydroxy-tetrahydrodipicolinate synthase [Bacteroidota bacterium]
MINEFRGTGVALVTPFRNGEIDFDGLEKVIEHTLSGKVEFLVSLGTTGEAVTLSEKEKLQILEFTAVVVKGRVPLVAGFGGNNTASLLEAVKAFHFKGYQAILSASPSYNKPTQEGIFQHFMALESVAPRPIILYNVPGRTSSNMTAQTTVRLAKASSKFIAVKEASGDMVQCMEIVRDRPENFLLLSGDDVLTLPMLGFGGDGLISVVANAFPKEYSEMVRHGLDGHFGKARPNHYALMDIIDLLFVDGNPGGVKYALETLGICSSELRLPLVSISETTKQALQSAISTLQTAKPQ